MADEEGSDIIQLTNGLPQSPASLIVPNGSVGFQLNVDATVIAPPYGFVAASIEIVFQFDATGLIQPNAPAAAAQIYSNKELQPQNSIGLGTYYLVTFYDADGARINKNPMWWQFPEAAGATVDISNITPISTVGGNVIFYPTNFAGSGTVTSVAFVGDGTVLSATPSTPVTISGNIAATLLTQNPNLIFAGPPTPGPSAAPTFRFLIASDVNPAYAAQTLATSLANQSSPIFQISGNYWTGSVSAVDMWTIRAVLGAGTDPTTTLTFGHTGTGGGSNIDFGGTPFSGVGNINATGLSVGASGINILNTGQLSFQSANAAQQIVGQSSELITLNTGGATTDSVTNLLPAGAIIDAVVIRVTTTISGGSTPTTIAVGDASTSNRFISTGTPLTAGSTAIGLNQIDAGAASQAAAAKVRITLDQTPGQGAVRVTVFWRTFSAPTS